MKKILLFLSFLLMSISVWSATWQLNPSDFNGSSYAANDGDHTKNGITYNTYNVMLNSSNIQLKKNSGVIYNKTAFSGNITKITAGGGLTIKVGTSQNPSSGTTVTSGNTISGNYTYFWIKNNTNGVVQISSITIEYSDTPPTPCETATVTLLDTENGSASLSETEICEGSSVEVTNILPDEGYMLDTIACLTTSYQSLGSVDMSTKTISGITEDCYVMVLFKKSPLEPDVDIVEWNPDYIKIDVENFENAELTAVILNKNTLEVHEDNVADSVFFSKYFEAASNIKLLGIYNGTNHTVNLSEYQIWTDDGDASGWSGHKSINELFKSYSVDSLRAILEPGSELILIGFQNIAADSAIINCAIEDEESNYGTYIRLGQWLSFNGDDAIALVNPEGELIDLIGAGTKSGGRCLTGGDVVTTSSNNGDVNGFMDKPGGWYTEKGYKSNLDNTEEANYKLSSNRCLLIRRKHVKSGLAAVQRNTTKFLTLGDYEYNALSYEGEWKGIQIPGKTSEGGATATCNGFAQVGKFDYNAYYATYQTLETIDLTEDGFLQPDGTYRINIDDLDLLSCTLLKVIVSDDDTEVDKEYKIPIMVKTNSKTTDKIFTDEGSDCATCDVVVLAGKKLTAAGTESTNRDLKLYQGAELIIPEDSTYHLTSLSIQKYNDSVAALNVDGTLVVNKLYFDLYLTKGVWSYVALPDTFTSRKVKFANGNVAEYGEDYSIGYYDGSYRALHGRGGWKFASADQKFAPGIGFIISLNDTYKSKELRIELPVDSILGELHNKNITNLHSWSATAANDIGWNLVGNPYMAIYLSDLGDPIHIGELVQEDSDPWNGRWTYRGDSRYAVVPSTDSADAPAGYYKSVLLSEHKLNPFTAFFVLLGGESNSTYGLNFHADHRTNRVVRKVTETEESFLRIIIGDYKTGCFISDKFTDEYEPGDDLESNYPIYQEIGGYKLLYSAINDSVLETGINVYSNGGNVLLDNKTDINSFEYIYLNYENEWFDLLHENIVNIPGNFKLFGKRKRNLATDLEYIPTNGIFKFMKDGSVYINKNNLIFNILGLIQ